MNNFSPDKNKSVLLVVDIQERLAVTMNMRDAVIGNCLHLIELAKMQNVPILVSEQYPKGLGQTVSEIRDALPAYKPIEKLAFSCCGEPSYMNALKALNRKTVILTGMETHICVLQTCVDLLEEGFTVHLVRDAVCSRTKDNWEVGIEFMRDAGALVTSTETVLFQLLKVAGTEDFKTISKRIK
ncbi:MAG: hydrolase [Nitrospirae bacterium]|nr:hydrolase [Nitrospirota bacterium]